VLLTDKWNTALVWHRAVKTITREKDKRMNKLQGQALHTVF